MTTVRWGMIGCGNVTEKKSAPAFQQVDNSDLVAVASRTFSKAKDYAARKGIPLCFEDPAEMIQSPDVDAIYIATPPDSHAGYTIAAMEVGKPVYVEKPMARTFAECERLLAKGKETGVPLFVAYYRRTLPYFMKAKGLIDSKVIGDVESIEINMRRVARELDPKNLPWRYVPEIAGGGLFVDLASHALDFLDFCFGPLTVIDSQVENRLGMYRSEDYVAARLSTEADVPLNGVWSFSERSDEDVDRVEITGKRGKIVFSCFKFTPIELHLEHRRQLFEIESTQPIQKPLVEQVVGSLLRNTPCVSTGETASRTSRVIDDILSAYRSSNRILLV